MICWVQYGPGCTLVVFHETTPVVEFTVPYAGHALIALADRETRMLVIGGPAALIALIALVSGLVACSPGADTEGADLTGKDVGAMADFKAGEMRSRHPNSVEEYMANNLQYRVAKVSLTISIHSKQLTAR